MSGIVCWIANSYPVLVTEWQSTFPCVHLLHNKTASSCVFDVYWIMLNTVYCSVLIRIPQNTISVMSIYLPERWSVCVCVCVCVCLSPMFAGLCHITICPPSCRPRILSLWIPRVCRRHRKRVTLCVSAGGTGGGGGGSSSSSSSSHHHQQHAAPQQQFITIPLPMTFSTAAAMQEAADLTKSRKWHRLNARTGGLPITRLQVTVVLVMACTSTEIRLRRSARYYLWQSSCWKWLLRRRSMVLYSATNVFGRGWPGVVVVLPGAVSCHYANDTRFSSVSYFIGLGVCCLAKIIPV